MIDKMTEPLRELHERLREINMALQDEILSPEDREMLSCDRGLIIDVLLNAEEKPKSEQYLESCSKCIQQMNETRSLGTSLQAKANSSTGENKEELIQLVNVARKNLQNQVNLFRKHFDIARLTPSQREDVKAAFSDAAWGFPDVVTAEEDEYEVEEEDDWGLPVDD